MPQQSNESSATPRPWEFWIMNDGNYGIGRVLRPSNSVDRVAERIFSKEDADLICNAVNSYKSLATSMLKDRDLVKIIDENQATIEKQGKVIKDLASSLREVREFAHDLSIETIKAGIKFEVAKKIECSHMCARAGAALNSIPKEML